MIAFANSIQPGLLAQEDAAAGILGLVFVVMILVMAVAIVAVGIFIILFLQSCFERVPYQYRDMEPWQVWLLLIPGFGIIWLFFVYPKLAQSYQKYFTAMGRYDVGDCGYQLAIWYCILTCLSALPLVGMLTSIPAMILWIIFLVKAKNLKDQIPRGGGFAPAAYAQKPAGW